MLDIRGLLLGQERERREDRGAERRGGEDREGTPALPIPRPGCRGLEVLG